MRLKERRLKRLLEGLVRKKELKRLILMGLSDVWKRYIRELLIGWKRKAVKMIKKEEVRRRTTKKVTRKVRLEAR